MIDQRGNKTVPIWKNEIQCFRSREKSRRPKGTQIEVNVADAMISSPPYITRSDTSNTKIEEHKCDICKCNNKKPKTQVRDPKTWQSITNLYGDVDTTEVWDDTKLAPQPIHKSKFTEKSERANDVKAVGGNKVNKSRSKKKTKKETSILNSKNPVQFKQHIELTEPILESKNIEFYQPKNKNISKVKRSNRKSEAKKKAKESDKNTFYKKPKSPADSFLNTEKDICYQTTCKEILKNSCDSQKLSPDLSGVEKPLKKLNKTEKASQKRKLKENYLDCTCKRVNTVNNKTNLLQYQNDAENRNENIGIGDHVRHTEKLHTHLKHPNQLNLKFNKKPNTLHPKRNLDEKVNLCTQSTCKEIFKHLYNSGKLSPELLKSIPINNTSLNTEGLACKCKNIKTESLPSENIYKEKKGNIGIGDQLKEIKYERKELEKKCRCSIINKIFGTFRSKQKVEEQKTKQEVVPLFEIKVDSRDMHVINRTEIRNKVKSLGKPAKHCVCPSRIKKIKTNVCEAGVCEMARTNKENRFLCNCPIKENLECKDSTCNEIGIIRKSKKPKMKKGLKPFQSDEINKPMFEVVLDDTNMSLVNSREIIDIFKKASKDGICPDGICRTVGPNSDVSLNCKCVNKKIHQIPECSEGTCFIPLNKKSKLSYLYSRIFSKSDNWTKTVQQRRNNRPTRRDNITYTKEAKKRSINTKSDTFRKRAGLNIDIPRNHKLRRRDTKDLSEIWCKCFCECDKINNKTKKQEALKKENNIKKNKMKMKKKKQNKNQSKLCCRKKRNKPLIPPEDMTCDERIKYCIEEGRRKCDEALEAKEKLYIKKEKKKTKEAKLQTRQIKEYKRKSGSEWNCLTNFVSGSLNLFVKTAANIVVTPFRAIADPLGSFIYVRQKARNPVLAVAHLFGWISRTWKSKDTYMSSVVQRSDFMNIIADHLEDSPVFESISSKGKTKDERANYERNKNIRKRRIQQRHNEAIYGCRHMLLVTMRKTPCLWFYHICPDLYPQCLSLVSFLNNFIHIIIYIIAVMCWTPCILSFEICRAFLCCFLCTN